MNERKVLTVYAVDENGRRFRVAGYDEKTALKVVNDRTVMKICHAVSLVAVDKNGCAVATSDAGKEGKK